MAVSREHIVSRTLQIGIYLSGGLLLLGFVLYAFQPEFHTADIPVATWKWLRDLFNAPGEQAVRSPFVYLYAGILVLMLTPILRVIITGYTFYRERDWHYVWISLVVLAIIGVSIGLSFSH